MKPYRGTSDYIDAVRTTSYFQSGDWFPVQYVAQRLNAQGFRTTTSRLVDVCGTMVDDGILDKQYEDVSKNRISSRRALYRRRSHGREYLARSWRKHTNEQLEVSQCCLFPA